MVLFEFVIALLLAGALLFVWSRRAGVPYPALLSLAGAAAALIPGIPVVTLEPELALVLFVAPTLLDAAYDASPRDMRDNWLPIGALAIVVVGLTVAAVAVVARALVPAMPWTAAIALGAIVAPPDASAATAVLRQLRPPHRLLVILEGESLWNDATALLVYRVAIGAAAGGPISGWRLAPVILFTAFGGGALGWALARLWLLLPLRRAEIPVAVLVQFLTTFAVWILADQLGVSAIITMVVYAITLAQYESSLGARHRIASYAVWDVAVFVLNMLAFVLIGLQLKGILGRLDGGWDFFAIVAVAVCAAVIAVRIVWVMTYNAMLRWKIRHFGPGTGRPLMRPTIGGGLLVSWCGMRGIVTLATALALPESFAQGLTLRPLMQRVHLPADNSVQEEIHLARRTTAQAAMQMLEAHGASEPVAMLRREYRARAAGGAEAPTDAGSLAGLQGRTVAVQRRALQELRRDGTIGDDAFHAIEEELDIIELTANPRVRTLDGPRQSSIEPSASAQWRKTDEKSKKSSAT
jgi:NhaP-type Na+/H+ or K+/H+ antiporter